MQPSIVASKVLNATGPHDFSVAAGESGRFGRAAAGGRPGGLARVCGGGPAGGFVARFEIMAGAGRSRAVSVRDLVEPVPVRLAQSLASSLATAALVRDVAAFAALVVLATMFSLLSGFEASV